MYFYLLLPISIPGVRMPYPLCLLSNVFKYKYLPWITPTPKPRARNMDCDCDCEIFFFQEWKKVACARDRREHVPDFLIDFFLESGFD